MIFSLCLALALYTSLLTSSASAVTAVTISNVQTFISNQYVIIQFETDIPVKANIVYSDSSSFSSSFSYSGKPASIYELNEVTKHQLILNSAEVGGTKKIYYKFVDPFLHPFNSDVFILDLLPDSQKIEFKKDIYQIPIVDIYDIKPTSMRLKWSTNQPTTGKVYITNQGSMNMNRLIDYDYDQSFDDTNLSIQHDLLISGLSPSTTYYFGIQAFVGNNFAYTSAGNLGTASELWHNMRNFFADISSNSVIITWNFDHSNILPILEYGLTTSYGNKIETPVCQMSNGFSYDSCTATISNLASGTTYHYRVKHDTEYSPDKIFTTKTASSGVIKPTCSSWVYSNWNTCVNNQQTRTMMSASPTNCLGGTPILIQSCNSSSNINTGSYSKNVNSNFIKVNDNPSVYWLSADNKRYLFSNRAVFSSWFINNFNGLRNISQNEFDNIQSGENLTVKPGNNIKFDNSNIVYYVTDNNNICKTNDRSKLLFIIQSSFEADYKVTGNCL